MSLLENAEQAVSVTDMNKHMKDYVDNLMSGQSDRYVLMKNNKPAAVVLNIPLYEMMSNEIEDLRASLIAQKRMEDFDEKHAISHEEMRDFLQE